jgi:hypothetical protein
VTGPSVVNQNVEVAGFGKSGIECLLDAKRIAQIEADRMPSRHFWDAFQIARCAPNIMTLSDEQLRNGQTNARARAGKKNFSHDLENGLLRTRIACYHRIDSYFNYRPDARVPTQQSHYCASRVKDSSNLRRSIRVIASLSTVPDRIDNLRPTIRSLLKQTRPLDEIVLTIPEFSVRERRPYVVLKHVSRLPRVRVLRCRED